MTHPPLLTDRAALDRNRKRAMRLGFEPFLHEDAADEIEERLAEVNRRFTQPAIVTGFPEFWQRTMPEALVTGDAELLDLRQGAHDLVIHALALHWANDPVGQLIQCRRALRPDGLFIGVMFGGRTLSELRAVMAETETRLHGGLSPRVAPMGEIRDLGALLQRAEFALPVADASVRTVSYAGMAGLTRDLRRTGEGSALAARGSALNGRFAKAAEDLYLEVFPADGGRIRATFEMIFLTGWAPSESQPKPLRPGTAAARLADALGSAEMRLPDTARPDAD